MRQRRYKRTDEMRDEYAELGKSRFQRERLHLVLATITRSATKALHIVRSPHEKLKVTNVENDATVVVRMTS